MMIKYDVIRLCDDMAQAYDNTDNCDAAINDVLDRCGSIVQDIDLDDDTLRIILECMWTSIDEYVGQQFDDVDEEPFA